jgi:hypothetical protein
MRVPATSTEHTSYMASYDAITSGLFVLAGGALTIVASTLTTRANHRAETEAWLRAQRRELYVRAIEAVDETKRRVSSGDNSRETGDRVYGLYAINAEMQLMASSSVAHRMEVVARRLRNLVVYVHTQQKETAELFTDPEYMLVENDIEALRSAMTSDLLGVHRTEWFSIRWFREQLRHIGRRSKRLSETIAVAVSERPFLPPA